MLIFFIYIHQKKSRFQQNKINLSSTTVFNIDNNLKYFLSIKSVY